MSSNVIKKIKLPNNVTYDIGGGVPTFTGTKAEWDALTNAQKAEYEIVNLTDDYDLNVEIDDTTPASNKVYSSQKTQNELNRKVTWNTLISGLNTVNWGSWTDNGVDIVALDLAYTNENVLRFQWCDVSGILELVKYMKSNDTWTTIARYAKTSDLPVWTSGVSALTGATSCTITNNAISSSSVLEVFYENTSGTDPVAKVTSVSSHTATIEFSALAENTTFYLRVTNL